MMGERVAGGGGIGLACRGLLWLYLWEVCKVGRWAALFHVYVEETSVGLSRTFRVSSHIFVSCSEGQLAIPGHTF